THLPLEINELAIEIAGHELREPLAIAIQAFRQLAEHALLIAGLHDHLRRCPYRVDRRRDRERLAVAVVNAAAVRRQRLDAHEALIALIREEAVVENLQLDGARHEPDEKEPEQDHHDPRAAAEQFDGERATFVSHHGCTIFTSAALGIVMRKSPRAICST